MINYWRSKGATKEKESHVLVESKIQYRVPINKTLILINESIIKRRKEMKKPMCQKGIQKYKSEKEIMDQLRIIDTSKNQGQYRVPICKNLYSLHYFLVLVKWHIPGYRENILLMVRFQSQINFSQLKLDSDFSA